MSKKSERYWADRAEKRMTSYLEAVEKDYNLIAEAYLRASDEIHIEAGKVFKNFVQFSGVTENEAIALLKREPDNVLIKNLRNIASKILDPEKRKELINIINSPAYSYRIKRWEELGKNIDRWITQLGTTVAGMTATSLTQIAEQAYYRTIFDIQQGAGIGFSFSSIPQSRVKQLLRQNWSGTHYSKRIWNNTEQLSQKLKNELLTGFLTGRSYAKTAANLRQEMASGSMQCKRIVRTEANYISNQSELEAYKECGAKKYIYVATLDLKTSKICRDLDGKRFLIEKAKSGTNFPPMHPWCRSTTIMYFSDAILQEMQRRAKDPKTGESILIPADTTYREWYSKFVV